MNKYLIIRDEITEILTSDDRVDFYADLKQSAIESGLSLYQFHLLLKLGFQRKRFLNSRVEDTSGWIIDQPEFAKPFKLKSIFADVVEISNKKNVITKKAKDLRTRETVLLKVLNKSVYSKENNTYFLEKYYFDKDQYSGLSDIYKLRSCCIYYRPFIEGSTLKELVENNQLRIKNSLSFEDKQIIHAIWEMTSALTCYKVDMNVGHIIITTKTEKDFFSNNHQYKATMVGFNFQKQHTKIEIEQQMHELLLKVFGNNYTEYLNSLM